MKERQRIEKSWRENKYLVMYHHQNSYNAIRELLKSEIDYSAYEDLLNKALEQVPTHGSKMNAYQHVYGYFKKVAQPEEKEKVLYLINQLETEEKRLNDYLYELARKYDMNYLLESTLLNNLY